MPDRPPIITWGIVTPSHFYYPKLFVECALKMASYSQFKGVTTGFNFAFLSSPRTSTNRNEVLESMTGVEDYALMIDSDMTFEMNALELLMETASKNPDAIITGIAPIGKPPFRPAIFDWPEREDKKPVHIDEWPDEPFEIGATGSFCMLIPKNIAKGVGEKPFDHIHDYFPWGTSVEDRELRHDFAFSKRVREAGFRIICDPRVQLGHIRPIPMEMEDWIRNRDMKKPRPPR